MADPIQSNASYDYTPDYTPIEGPPAPGGEGGVLECREGSEDALAGGAEPTVTQPKTIPGNNAQRTSNCRIRA